MMKHLIFIFFVSLYFSSFSQQKCDLIEKMDKVFVQHSSQYKDRVMLYENAEKIDSSDVCASLVNDHLIELEYILTNFSNHRDREPILKKIKDSIKRQKRFISLLKKDENFMSILKKYNDVLNKTYDKDSITINDLMQVAVNYFYIFKITKKGNYMGRVCSGMNGLNTRKTNRKPLLETFCFATVYKHYTDGDKELYHEFIKGLKSLNTIDLGADAKEKLKQAQTAMYSYMKKSNTLKQLLLKAYHKEKDDLSFVLIDDKKRTLKK